MRNPGVKQCFAEKRVKWIVNLERAPWWGGLFERMVRSMKLCKKKTIGGAKLTNEELMTSFLKRTWFSIQDHFLTCPPLKVDEPLIPLKPLQGQRLPSLPDHRNSGDLTDPDAELSPKDLNSSMIHIDILARVFYFIYTYFPLFAPKAPRLIKGAYNNTIIRLKEKKKQTDTNSTQSYNK